VHDRDFCVTRRPDLRCTAGGCWFLNLDFDCAVTDQKSSVQDFQFQIGPEGVSNSQSKVLGGLRPKGFSTSQNKALGVKAGVRLASTYSSNQINQNSLVPVFLQPFYKGETTFWLLTTTTTHSTIKYIRIELPVFLLVHSIRTEYCPQFIATFQTHSNGEFIRLQSTPCSSCNR